MFTDELHNILSFMLIFFHTSTLSPRNYLNKLLIYFAKYILLWWGGVVQMLDFDLGNKSTILPQVTLDFFNI